MNRVAVITPSFNKTNYVKDAMMSVVNQSFTDFSYLIIENSTNPETRGVVHSLVDELGDPRLILLHKDFTPQERQDSYIPAVILNEYLPKMDGEIIFYLSDDDVFDPQCFASVVSFFDQNPGARVVYFSMVRSRGDQQAGVLRANGLIRQGQIVDCYLDGGQVAFRRECLAEMEPPYFRADVQEANHCDGMFLQRLLATSEFHPIDQVLLTHRYTELSTWNR